MNIGELIVSISLHFFQANTYIFFLLFLHMLLFLSCLFDFIAYGCIPKLLDIFISQISLLKGYAFILVGYLNSISLLIKHLS